VAQPPSLRAQFPSGPLIDETGEITPVWRAYFSQLYIRTGGAAGASSDTTQLQADLDAEEAARQAADLVLTTGLVAERTAREAADSAEAAARAQADAQMLPKAGGTMTGSIILPAATPTLPRQAVSKSYVDGAVGGTAYAPIDSPPFTGNPTAPTPAPGDADTSIATTAFVAAAVAPSLNNVGRNLLHNGLFNVAQRGAGPWTTTGYGPDRWFVAITGGVCAFAISPANDGNRAQIGDDACARLFNINVTTGGSAAGDATYIDQRIEGVHSLAGKTVTVSFWAAVASGGPKIGAVMYQVFGTGGSPSSATTFGSQSITATGTFTRYTMTFNVPSIAGKTLGTNGDAVTYLRLALSSGATSNASLGNIGVQSGNFFFWGVQLEIGSVATPLEKPDPQVDLANCQRFYQLGQFQMNAYQSAGNAMGYIVPLAVTMRAAPTFAPTFSVQSNCSGGTVSGASDVILVYSFATATGATAFAGTFTASADL
jgi:hypothetical protein